MVLYFALGIAYRRARIGMERRKDLRERRWLGVGSCRTTRADMNQHWIDFCAAMYTCCAEPHHIAAVGRKGQPERRQRGEEGKTFEGIIGRQKNLKSYKRRNRHTEREKPTYSFKLCDDKVLLTVSYVSFFCCPIQRQPSLQLPSDSRLLPNTTTSDVSSI